jgi:hypothetical protein
VVTHRVTGLIVPSNVHSTLEVSTARYDVMLEDTIDSSRVCSKRMPHGVCVCVGGGSHQCHFLVIPQNTVVPFCRTAAGQFLALPEAGADFYVGARSSLTVPTAFDSEGVILKCAVLARARARSLSLSPLAILTPGHQNSNDCDEECHARDPMACCLVGGVCTNKQTHTPPPPPHHSLTHTHAHGVLV